MYPTRNWSSKAGAEALAAMIREYWAARGCKVETVTMEFAPGFYSLRTDMVGGLPKAVRT